MNIWHLTQRKERPMSSITVGRENTDDIDIYYEDHGTGHSVVLIHGYPLNGRAWEKQEHVLLQAGYRVITYDRRGFGQSSKPAVGYDYDTLADDLNSVLEYLELTQCTLAGFAMGTGEVTRYLGTYGSARVRKAVLMGAIPPFLLKTQDNPDGVEQAVFDDIKAAIIADRPAYLKKFLDNLYNFDVLAGTRVSEQAWQNSFNVAVTASAHAMYACVDTWLTDFRDDLSRIDVPVLLIHGDADRILPYRNTSQRLPGLIADLTVVTVDGGPHNIAWTHPEVVNPALLEFLKK
jgi:non-heme chloroperoxidase